MRGGWRLGWRGAAAHRAALCRYYLDRPLLRQAIAEEGHRLFKERSAGRELHDAVAMLAANAGCHS